MKTKWQLISKLVKGNKLLTFTTFGSGLFYNLLTILIPIGIGKFYEFSFGMNSNKLKLLEAFKIFHTESFISFLYVFFLLVVLRFFFEHVNKYVIGVVGEKFSKDLREQLFKHQLQIKQEIYDDSGIGKYLLRYSGDLKSIQNYITNGILRFAQDVILILIVIGTIGLINYRLSVIVGIFLAVSTFVLWVINNKLYTISKAQRNQKSNMLSFVNTRLRAIASIKIFNKYRPEENRYIKHSNKLYLIGKKNRYVVSLIESIIPLLTYTMLGAIMWYIYDLKNANETEFNETSLLILILLIISFLPILRRILRVSMVWRIGDISFKKLIGILQLDHENQLPFNNLNLSKEAIRFNKVSFHYKQTKNLVFNNLNLTLFPKQSTLIIGASGSGKNTLIKLILKLYTPSQGTITFGEQNFSAISEKTLRKNIAILSNSFPLYGKTVHEAIVYSMKKEKAPKVRKLLDTLQQFEKAENHLKLEDPIGDLGAKLTNGQKRLLMYCRLFLTNKPWFIIDQPLLDLNPKTQWIIIEKLTALKGKKNLVIIDKENIETLKTDKTIYLE